MRSSIVNIFISLLIFLAAIQLILHENQKKNLNSGKSLKTERKELEATEALEAMRWYNDQRAYPSGSIPLDWREKAIAHSQKYNLKKISSTSSLSWESVGPNNIAGRVRSVAIDPANPNIIFSGSVSGGLWKSTNAGASWLPLTDFAPNLVIGCLTFHPTNSNIIYAGTGEGYFCVDALRGVGVLKSTDGGASWTILKNFIGASAPYYYYYINKIVIRPDQPNTMFAAVSSTDAGIWKSTDAGDSWRKLSSAGTSSGFCVDLVMDPNNPDVMYGAFGLFSPDGIYKTTDGGSTWNKLTSGFPSTSTKYNRISLALAPSNPSILYASLSDSNYYTHSIQKSINAGGNWFEVGKPIDYSAEVNGGHLGGQGWYNNVIAVHPTNPNIVYAGGINLFKSIDGGSSWNKISDGYRSPYVHVDQHAIVFNPTNPLIIYFGNDGGMFKSTDGGSSFVDINTDLRTTQFYSCTVHPTTDIYYGGTQDNGTLKTFAPPHWSMVHGGDGGITIIDYSTPSTVYGEYVYLCLLKSPDAGFSWTRMMNGIPTSGSGDNDGTSDRSLFISPYTMDPSNSQVLIAGTYRVFRTSNGAASWTAISGDLTGDGAGHVQSKGSAISAIAIAKSSPATIYVGTSGSATSASRVLVTTNGTSSGATWTNITKSPLPDRYVESIVIDPTNSDRAIVGYSGYGTGHIFATTNRGTTWKDCSGDLPDIPVNVILLDQLDSTHLIVGTDLGIFETTSGGVNWFQQNSGLANVSVTDLDLRNDGYVFAATHGRGMFKSSYPISSQTSNLAVVIHQNAILTKYIDLYVTSQESLSSTPTVQVMANYQTTQPIILHQNSLRVFKGTYELSADGNVIFIVSAVDSSGRQISMSRTLRVQLLKPGVTASIRSSVGEATITVPADAISEEMYFTVTPDYEIMKYPFLSGRAFIFGPARQFSRPLTITFAYNDEVLNGKNENFLSVYQKTDGGWIPLESYFNPHRKMVSARITTLGTFAIGFNENGNTQQLPEKFLLEQNYPNPFNPLTTIKFVMPEPGRVTLRIYNIIGQEIKTLLDENRDIGQYEAIWDGRDNYGNMLASGVYFYKLDVRADGKLKFDAVGKMMMIK